MATKEELLQKLSDMVFEMEDEEIADVCEEYIEAGFDPLDGILHGLVDGMNRASDMYDQEEYFVTDLLLCSDAMYAGLDVLRPHLPEDASMGEQKKAVIGVVEGDTHDSGKNLFHHPADPDYFDPRDHRRLHHGHHEFHRLGPGHAAAPERRRLCAGCGGAALRSAFRHGGLHHQLPAGHFHGHRGEPGAGDFGGLPEAGHGFCP